MIEELKFRTSLIFAKGLNKLIELIDKERGSNLSGEKALLIDKEMVKHFKNIDPDKVIFITGTNGKSSVTNLIVHALRENGFKVVSNLEGANLLQGLATSLSKESNLKGEVEADYFVFETDERYLPLIYEQLPAKNMLIMNLQKDQVQRNGDPDFIMRKLQSFVNPDIRLFLNNDEPRAKSYEDYSDTIVTFGVDKNPESFMKDQSFPTLACPKCHHEINFDYYNVDGVGEFSCPHCGFKSEDKPDYLLEKDNDQIRVNQISSSVPYNMAFMNYNYAAAIAVCHELAGLEIEDILKTFPSFKNIGGRFETFSYGDKTIKYMRIKQENPDTLQSALNIMAEDKNDKSVFLGLYPIHDFTPGYTNTFYTYDCDFNPLLESGVDNFYFFSPAVCYDTALRLIYEGYPEEKIVVEETEDPEKIFNQIESNNTDNIYLITWLHTFNDLKKYVEKHERTD